LWATRALRARPGTRGTHNRFPRLLRFHRQGPASLQHDSIDDVFVGVDVGKGQHHAVALDRNGKRLFNKALPKATMLLACCTFAIAYMALSTLIND
jgi:hypothetical protein